MPTNNRLRGRMPNWALEWEQIKMLLTKDKEDGAGGERTEFPGKEQMPGESQGGRKETTKNQSRKQ